MFMFLMSVDRPDAPWSFLNAYKSAAQSVPRTAMVTEMLRNIVVARFVASALPKAIKEKTTYHTLIAFHTAILLEYISRSKALDDAALVVLLPAMLEPLQEGAIRTDALTKDVAVSVTACPFLPWLIISMSTSCPATCFSVHYHKNAFCRMLLSE